MDPNATPPQINPMPPEPAQPPQSTQQLAEARSAAYLRDNPLAAMQDGEEIIADIRRHPYGIVSQYIFAFIGLAAACGVILVLIPRLVSMNSSDNSTMLSFGLIGIVLLFTILGLGVATMIYWQNRWVITSDSITQITQRGLFSRQVSQLSLGNLEDVTADQRGLIQNMFNFGTLRVETAGERSKFFFLYCPDPNLYARKILLAREIYLQNGGTNR